MARFIDLTGHRFGKLTVIKRVEDYISPKGQRDRRWLCKCDCENYVVVRGSDLKSKNTQSCGCLNRENLRKATKKYNIYDLSGEYGIGYTSKGEEFYFDKEDFDKIKDYCWRKDKLGYIVATYNNCKRIFIHRLIMDSPDDLFEIDHRYGKETRYDNRKYNLRISTHSQNMMNVGVKNNNTSGVVGVCWHSRDKKWVASIKVNNINHQKYFNNFNDAVFQRKEWEEKYFGEFSYDNSIGGDK